MWRSHADQASVQAQNMINELEKTVKPVASFVRSPMDRINDFSNISFTMGEIMSSLCNLGSDSQLSNRRRHFHLNLVQPINSRHALLPPQIRLMLEKEGSSVSLGRKGTDIVIDDGEMRVVSRLHARIEHRKGGSIHIVDAKSTNGVAVNGVRVQERMLHDGDIIQFGGARGVNMNAGIPRQGHNDTPQYKLRVSLAGAVHVASRKRRLSTPAAALTNVLAETARRTPAKRAARSGGSGWRSSVHATPVALSQVGDKNTTERVLRPHEIPVAISDLRCCICHQLLLDAAVLPCSHGFCLVCINRALGRLATSNEKSEGETNETGCGDCKGSTAEQCRTGGSCPVCSAVVSSPPVRCMHLDSICRKAAEKLVGDEQKQWQERLESHHEAIAPLLEAEAAAAEADVQANAVGVDDGDGDAHAVDAVEQCGSDDEAGGEPRCASCNEIGHAEHECPYRDDDEEEGLRESDHQESSSSDDDDDSDDLEAGETSGIDSSDDDYN